MGMRRATEGARAGRAEELSKLALELYDLGFNVVPVARDKKPLCNWSSTSRLDRAKLKELLPKASAVAVVQDPGRQDFVLVPVRVGRPDVLERYPTLRRFVYGNAISSRDPSGRLTALLLVPSGAYEKYLKGLSGIEEIELLPISQVLLDPSCSWVRPPKFTALIDTEVERLLEELRRGTTLSADLGTGECKAPTEEGVVSVPLIELPEDLLKEHRPRLILTRVASELARELVELFKVKVPVVNNVPLGTYCYEGGAYVECEERLLHVLEYHYRTYGLEERGVSYRSLRAEFLAHVEDSAKVFRGFNHRLLLFKNVVVDWASLVYEDRVAVYDPDPELMVYHRIPWEVDVETLRSKLGRSREELAKDIEQELGELTEVFKQWVGDRWVLLYEIVGYTLLAGEYPLNKAVMLVGSGKNGKSTYLGLLTRLLGSWNVVSVKLQELASDRVRFSAANLFGKLANVFADLPSEALRSTGLFKVLTGEDPVTADRKYRDPITFTNYAKMVYSTNELPKVYDMSTAFWRRWLVVEFPNEFLPNEGFKRRLYNEVLPKYASKVLACSLLLARHVVREGRFSFEGTEVDYREYWLRETNSVYAFIQDLINEGRLVRDPEGRAKADELYNLYVKYCEREERDVLAKREFTLELQRLGFPKVKVKGYYYYKGLTIVPEDGKEGALGGRT